MQNNEDKDVHRILQDKELKKYCFSSNPNPSPFPKPCTQHAVAEDWHSVWSNVSTNVQYVTNYE